MYLIIKAYRRLLQPKLNELEAGSQSTNIKAGLLTIMGLIAFIWMFGVSSTISPYYSALAYTYPYCYTDASNDDHCFSDRVQCQQSAQLAVQDKNDCDRIGFHAKYTASWEVAPSQVRTFYWDNKAQCEQAAQQHGVQCTRVQ